MPYIHWLIRLRQKSHSFLTSGPNWEPISQNLMILLLFYQHSQPVYDVMRKEIDNIEIVQGVNIEIKDSLNEPVRNICWSLTVHVKRLAIQSRSLSLLLLKDIVDWVLITLSTTCFLKANLGDTSSSRTRTWFSSKLPVMCVSTFSAQLGFGLELVD